MSAKPKKRYYQHFKDEYSKEFTFVTKSRLGSGHAFCTCCRTDISISHGGKNDIVNHMNSKKHKDSSKVVASNDKIKSFFTGDDLSTIKAECLFTSFLIEHNLPINCSDHAGNLFRKMFPNCPIAKNYGCGKTKTSAIISEMSVDESTFLKETMRNRHFAIATDGSNDVDSKLYPVVVTIFNPVKGKIVNSLLSISSLEGDSTGINIGKMLIKTLESNNIPLSNMVALSCDNAPVMVGSKVGVALQLKQKNDKIEIRGCICHLINLAAEKGAACMPFSIDDVLVDIYYYLQKSSKRKDRLKALQELYNSDVKKILKHVSTRWLSVGKCLDRVLQQWQPLLTFFKEEAMKTNKVDSLSFYKIPLNKNAENSKNVTVANSSSKGKRKLEKDLASNHAQKKKKINNFVQREERIFYFLSTDLNKAFCNFLAQIVPIFEKYNVKLQSAEPMIHILKSLLEDLFKEVLIMFVKPGPIKLASNVLYVEYHKKENQKEDKDLIIGNLTSKLLEELDVPNQDIFYDKVRLYLTTSCDYMRNKFPFSSEVLQHSQIARIENFENASFSSILYFVNRFSIYFGKTEDEAVDLLKKEFSNFQIFDVPQDIKDINRIDEKWYAISQIKDDCGQFKFKYLSEVMLVILSIPHSNVECERVFSKVKKIRTDFRSSMSNETLEKLLIIKCNQNEVKCFEKEFDTKFLKSAKSCSTSFVHKK